MRCPLDGIYKQTRTSENQVWKNRMLAFFMGGTATAEKGGRVQTDTCVRGEKVEIIFAEAPEMRELF